MFTNEFHFLLNAKSSILLVIICSFNKFPMRSEAGGVTSTLFGGLSVNNVQARERERELRIETGGVMMRF